MPYGLDETHVPRNCWEEGCDAEFTINYEMRQSQNAHYCDEHRIRTCAFCPNTITLATNGHDFGYFCLCEDCAEYEYEARENEK